ncbi:MAG: UvrD-helicase domain-containing protein [Candidatus Aminicenantes bacterium]|nr:UvrD-helicase domain-containing protein [Candidatus Aminicenantes bacterium]
MNPEQIEAVTHQKGPLLIIAGAGTGKTKVITHRIAYLIASKSAKPEEILAVTFTEKAANEMEERVDLLIPYSYSFVEISTFNSFGERVLRNYGLELGFPPDFKLLDEVEQAIFFREHLFRFPLKHFRPLSSPTKHIQELLSTIKRLKQEDIKPDEYLKYAKELDRKASGKAEKENARKHSEVAQVYQKYQDLLQDQGMIDFEDQILLVVELFRKRPSVLHEFQNRYKYILVDEFQDTNYIQFELLKLLAAQSKNLTVVGDDDQSIFRFRGASLSNILNFKEFYPRAKKIVLTRNYRSTQSILDSAYQLIKQNNPNRLEFKEEVDKTLEATVKSEGKSIHLLQFDSHSHEADKVAEIILEKIKEGYKYRDIAILVRRNADADPFLRTLNMKEIPFRFSGSRGLYSQEEVKILISFIKALTDFEDSKSLFYLAISEIYRVDPYDLAVVSNQAHKKNLPLHRVFKLIAEGKSALGISAETEVKIKKIFQDLLNFVQLASSQDAGRLLYAFLEKTGYLKSLVEAANLQAELKIKNIRLFFEKVKNFSDLTEDDSVFSFVRHLDLLQQVGDNPSTAEAELEEDAVSVLTVHKAKGLEFPVVFLVSLIADRFPGRERREKIPIPDKILKDKIPKGKDYGYEKQENIYLQEERRLFYVGMTRAKKFLYLSWARDYGLKRLKKVSPFVLEALDLAKVPEDVLSSTALEDIKRYAPRESQPRVLSKVEEKAYLTLSFFQVDDYLTCPLKYKYRHILRIPVLPHHNLVFGRVMHNAVYYYLKKKVAGDKMTEEELLREYENLWVNEGFLSREHEEMRKKAGEKALRLFFRREEESKHFPQFLEKSFKWQSDSIKFIGRWDRIDLRKEGAVLIDFKATEVKDKKEADRKAKNSLQMDLYALSFTKTQKEVLAETQLHFLESDIIGRAQKGEKELQRAMDKIKEAEQGIRSRDFKAKPDWHNCSHCEFKTICPSSYAY